MKKSYNIHRPVAEMQIERTVAKQHHTKNHGPLSFCG